MRKHKYSKVKGFLKISCEAEIHTIPKRWDEGIPILQNKYGKTETTPSSALLTDLELMKTHAIPNVWECPNSHNMEIFCGKPYHSQAVGFGRNLRIFYPFHWK